MNPAYEHLFGLVTWIAGGAGGLVIVLLGIFIGQNADLARKVGKLGPSVDLKFDQTKAFMAASIADLQLQLANNYVNRDDCSKSREANTTAHREIWVATNESREGIAHIKGRMTGDGA